jgi:hypothetical protein
VGWNRTVLERLGSQIDYISLHTYVGNPTNNFEQFLAFGQDVDDRIEVVKGQIRAVRVGNPQARPIHIAFDEWNVWYRTLVPGSTEYEIAKTGLEEHYNFEDALAMGVFLNAFFRHADVVKMANLAQLVNVIAPMFTNPQGLYFQTIYFPIAEYAKQRGNQSLDVRVDSPQYKPDKGRELGYLDVSATYDPKAFPRTLSQTGLFSSTKENHVADGVYRYEVASPQWQDGATAERFVALPGSSTIIDNAERKSIPGNVDWHQFKFHFPKNAVLVKTITHPDGKTRIHPAQMKMERLPVKGLLKLFFGSDGSVRVFPRCSLQRPVGGGLLQNDIFRGLRSICRIQ